jgi:hypothetical protein
VGHRPADGPGRPTENQATATGQGCLLGGDSVLELGDELPGRIGVGGGGTVGGVVGEGGAGIGERATEPAGAAEKDGNGAAGRSGAAPAAAALRLDHRSAARSKKSGRCLLIGPGAIMMNSMRKSALRPICLTF